MNLAIAPVGVPMKIIKIRIKGEQKKQLANMGFVEDAIITVVSSATGNIIVNIKDSRVGIGHDLSSRIIVSPQS